MVNRLEAAAVGFADAPEGTERPQTRNRLALAVVGGVMFVMGRVMESSPYPLVKAAGSLLKKAGGTLCGTAVEDVLSAEPSRPERTYDLLPQTHDLPSAVFGDPNLAEVNQIIRRHLRD